MTLMTRVFCAAGALLSLTSLATIARADGRDYNDGPVINVASIRTVDGHFDDYMHWLATGYKKQQEAAKKAGIITAYRSSLLKRADRTTRTSSWSRSLRTGPRWTASAASWTKSAPSSRGLSRRPLSPKWSA